MRAAVVLVLVLAALAVGAGLGYGWKDGRDGQDGHGGQARAPAAAGPESRAVLYYRHPMDSSVTSPGPAKDSMGMDYLPVYADPGAGAQGIAVSGALRQSLGVRTARAARVVLPTRVHATGTVAWDESRIVHLHTRVAGWVARLHAHTVGEAVRAGQVLATLDSNALDAAQREHLVAAGAGDAGLLAASRARLAALGMTPAQVSALERAGTSSRAVPVRAPTDGVITALGVRPGMYVTPDTELFALAPRDPVWVDAEVLDRQAAPLRAGDSAAIEVPGQPGAPRTAQVDYVYPQLDPATRAQRARLVVPNPDHALRPGMWVSVQLQTAPREALVVSAEAVIRDGDGERVVLALPDGRFDVRRVRTGAAGGADVEVLEGLDEGETVVVSGQFLLDAEAGTAAALAALNTGRAPTPPRGPEPMSHGAHQPKTDTGSGTTPPVGAAPAATTEAQTPGVVRAVDAAARTVTLEHPAIEAIGMPAMTMEFAVLPGVALDGLAPGMAVQVRLRPTGQGYALTAIERAP